MDTMVKNMKEKMEKTLDVLHSEFASMRAGRANPAILEKITVDYYGVPTPINQMAAVSVAEARILQIQPWDVSAIKEIEKAINASDIGINPQSDGKIIRLIFPPLTEERRRDLTKDIRKTAEDAKVAVRSVRRDTMEKFKAMKKKSEITEDDLSFYEKKVQDETEKFCSQIDDMASAKEKEIMEI